MHRNAQPANRGLIVGRRGTGTRLVQRGNPIGGTFHSFGRPLGHLSVNRRGLQLGVAEQLLNEADAIYECRAGFRVTRNSCGQLIALAVISIARRLIVNLQFLAIINHAASVDLASLSQANPPRWRDCTFSH